MQPFTIYHLCKEAFYTVRLPLVELVVKAANPDMVYLLGASLQEQISESIFNMSSTSNQYIAHCFILVLVNDLSGKEIYEWQDKIENNCKSLLPVTAMVLPTATFAQWIKKGHRFAYMVKQLAVLIYNSASYSIPAQQNVKANRAGMGLSLKYNKGITRAKEFMAGSAFFMKQQKYTAAAFMLHQSAEQALNALVETGTGYAVNTHNIGRLIRYAGLVSSRVTDIFLQNTEGQKKLLSLLQNAYIESRYNDDYKINAEELQQLTEKVNEVIDILADTQKTLTVYSDTSVYI